MGYDITGVRPKNKAGEEFRNNIWYWRPLWHLISNNTPELSDDDRRLGLFNEGHIIEDPQHKAIIRTLTRLLAERPAEEVKCALAQAPFLRYSSGKEELAHEVHLAGLQILSGHQFSWENVQRFLQFCENNEGFRIA